MTNQDRYILAGDIGGTNARFGCLERQLDGSWIVHHFAALKVTDYATFDDALEYYLGGLHDRPSRAALAAAGPVSDGCISLTNSNWQISTKRIIDRHNFQACGLYNDFKGMTRSIPELAETDFTIIRPGHVRKSEPILVAGAGTGFGVGYLVPTKTGWHTIATEGGHVAYNPRSKLEFKLLHVLQRSAEFVSLELVSSGIGLPIIHEAVCEIHGSPYIYRAPDTIRKLAYKGDPVAQDVCEIRVAATMGAIGDLALSGGARGGIVLAGGVSERMIDFYTQPTAMARFLRRGSQSDYVQGIPLRLLKNPLAPLIGASALLED